MTCLYCGAEVDEDTSSLPNKASRNLLNKFNTQMSVIFELLAKVEHVRLADFILRPEPVDMTLTLEKISSSSSIAVGASNVVGAGSGLQSSKSNPQLTGKAAMIKYDKWSGDKTRNADLLGQTRISINFDSQNAQAGANHKAKELPAILLFNRTQDTEDQLDTNNRDSILLNSVKMAADETILKDNVNSLNNNNVNKEGTQQLQQPKVAPAVTNGSTVNTGNWIVLFFLRCYVLIKLVFNQN
jgi:hypothetical protein